jgi:hypothetical protein
MNKPKPPFDEKEAESLIETHIRIYRTQGLEALKKYLKRETEERRKPCSDETTKKAS